MSEQMTDWASGPPPVEGWWNASSERDPDVRRYWHPAADGRLAWWSAPVYVGDPESHAERAKNTRAESHKGLEWRGLAQPRAAT